MPTANDRTFYLTGASSGIGKALALELGSSGLNVILAARRMELLEDVARQVEERGGLALPVRTDVTDYESMRRSVEAGIERFGGLDVVVFNAGLGRPPEGSEGVEGKLAVVRTNFIAVLYGFDVVVPLFRSGGGGVIVGVSSLADVRGFAGSAVYSASKAALTLYLEARRAELEPDGIHVMTVRPGFFRTPMTEPNKFHMPFLSEPDKLARAILRGIRLRRRMVVSPMPMWLLTGMLRRLPGWLFDRLNASSYRKIRKDHAQ